HSIASFLDAGIGAPAFPCGRPASLESLQEKRTSYVSTAPDDFFTTGSRCASGSSFEQQRPWNRLSRRPTNGRSFVCLPLFAHCPCSGWLASWSSDESASSKGRSKTPNPNTEITVIDFWNRCEGQAFPDFRR